MRLRPAAEPALISSLARGLPWKRTRSKSEVSGMSAACSCPTGQIGGCRDAGAVGTGSVLLFAFFALLVFESCLKLCTWQLQRKIHGAFVSMAQCVKGLEAVRRSCTHPCPCCVVWAVVVMIICWACVQQEVGAHARPHNDANYLLSKRVCQQEDEREVQGRTWGA